MTRIDEMSELMVNLIDSIDMNMGAMKFPEKARKIIKEISDYSRQTELYQENKERSEAFWLKEDATPEKIWVFMLEKVVDAPTSFHRMASVILHMPELNAALDKISAN